MDDTYYYTPDVCRLMKKDAAEIARLIKRNMFPKADIIKKDHHLTRRWLRVDIDDFISNKLP